jgi:uncharacterized repeat protein (TIGR03803 family)
LTTLYNFCQLTNCNDGSGPGVLIVGPGGKFYGTTVNGGVYGEGTIFEITPGGQLTTLYNFCSQPGCTDGENPVALFVGTDGNFYGTTVYGGNSRNINGDGTVFKMTPSGQLSTIYSFCSLPNCSDGGDPSSLVLGADGNFYGTAAYNHLRSTHGNIFRITPAGKLTVLYPFCSKPHCTDGSNPGGLVQGRNGSLYGTTFYGGANEASCFQGCGTVFEITPAGQFTTLYNFCSLSNCDDGELPGAPPVFDAQGNLYGTAVYGGPYPQQCNDNGCGTAFKLTPGGEFTVLYNFCSQNDCSDGARPAVSLVLGTNGNLYGTTINGGIEGNCDAAPFIGCGTVFSLSKAVKPFVESLPGFGIVGAEIGILGNKLTGATSVTFNGTPATFTVKSSTLIFASVPTGATTGYVCVTTANGTLISNVPFHVMP